MQSQFTVVDCIPDKTGKRCIKCGWVWKRNTPFPRRPCPVRTSLAIQQAFPQLTEAGKKLGITTEQIKHYATALAQWTAAGFPVRTQEEVDACLAVCKACEYYNAKRGRCKRCGCCVNGSRMAVFSKCRMKTEMCPEGKW